MNGKCRIRKAFSFCLTLVLAGPLFAQQDLQIMLNGPWAYYAPDPNNGNNIVLVTPVSPHHKTYIFGGTNAADLVDQTPAAPGVYTIKFSRDGGVLPDNTPKESPLVCTASSPASQAKLVAQGKPPSGVPVYVISVPKPDGYTTYTSPTRDFEGYSESKVYASDSSKKRGESIPPALYTTWMVLHYGFKNVPSTITGSGPGGAFTLSTNDTPSGVSIVASDPHKETGDNECDYISLESFSLQRDLWGTDLKYARFPKESINPPGPQLHYHYDYDGCRDDAVPKPTGTLHGLSGGSADCHACQMGINGIVIQSPVTSAPK
ncbi:MAG TPA: hypothetical protein VI386_21120 [Candidatus Sulfotelmatobacter sp.]